MHKAVSCIRTSGTARRVPVSCLICALVFSTPPHIRPLFAETHGDTIATESDFLAASIYDQLAADKSVAAGELQVEADRGVIVLRGRVHNLRAKKAAERCIQGRIGVRKVVNLLEIKPVGELEKDEVLTAEKIDSALGVNPYLSGRTIRVAVSEGAVILSGVVHNSFERNQALLAAERIAGVDSIVNKIEVVENYLEAGESSEQLAHSYPAVQALIDSMLKTRGIDPDLSISLDANMAAYWKDSLATDPPVTGRKPIVINPETGYYEYFDFFWLVIEVGKYLIKKVLSRDKDKNKD